ncbi:MAG TPA: glycolate oxidase subunit GlcE [Burkholderiaceae bacterium]|nr:glycolate oxidase subunit GlcE [Burkholderiaceae bacterium]
MQDMLDELAGRVRAAAARKQPLQIRAGGTKDFYGNAPRGEVLDPRGHSGIVDYEPTELVVTVRCGTPLAELESALDVRGQMLPFEPPHYGAGATVGGCVAAGLAGPRRASFGATYGGVRDFMLGAKLIDGRGQLLSFGGTVMKNVAGYDVARALAGSLGILGIIVEVSLKVLPKAVCEATQRMDLDASAALDRVNDWAALPLPISATAWRGGTLHVRLSGAAAAVHAAAVRLGGETVEPARADAFWRGVREHTHAFFAVNAPLWRLSVPSTAPPLSLDGEQFVEWGGALRWLRSTAPAAQVRERAAAAGGHATLFRGGDRSGGAFAPLAAPVLAIHKRLKAEFDPYGLFNPGRMYENL